MKLYNYLKERLCADKMTYIFLDEVQEVPSFEKVVGSLYIRDYVDVYITGSNAYTAESLNELLREAEKIMEGWTDYR